RTRGPWPSTTVADLDRRGCHSQRVTVHKASLRLGQRCRSEPRRARPKPQMTRCRRARRAAELNRTVQVHSAIGRAAVAGFLTLVAAAGQFAAAVAAAVCRV